MTISFLPCRLLDTVIAACALVVFAPFLAGIAIIIRLGGGPVIYRARRVGKDGRLFDLYKFRTMAPGVAAGRPLTLRDDDRITVIGRFLRRAKLDELPQLINVLAGDMSLVGPRPEDPRYVRLYSPAQRKILAYKPGLTSAASIKYRAEEQLLMGSDWETTYTQVILPEKLRIDLDYLSRRTFKSDAMIVIRTIGAVLRG